MITEETSLENYDETENQPNSIADRRKLYEIRSQSLIEEKKKSTVVGRQESFKEPAEAKKSQEKPNSNRSNGSTKQSTVSNKRTSTVFGKVSKFRHLKGTTAHKSTHIENIKNVSRQISGECDGFHGNFN